MDRKQKEEEKTKLNKFDLEVAPFFVFGCNIEFEVDNLLTKLKCLLMEFGWNLE